MNQKIRTWVQSQFERTDVAEWPLKQCIAVVELFYVGGFGGFVANKGR